MPGNSQRRGRRTASKKGATVGSGGKNRSGLAGRGRTLPADERPWHKGYSGDEQVPKKTAWKQEKERRIATAQGRAPKVGTPGTKTRTGTVTARSVGSSGRPRVAPGRRGSAPKEAAELLVGRNPVVEALRSHIPAMSLYVAQGIDIDERVTEIVRTAADRGLPVLDLSRAELD